MPANLFVFHTDPLIVLAEDLPRRWRHAQLRNDLRTWRSLGVYLFDYAAVLAREDLQWIAEFHDTLASIALQHAYDLQPVRNEDVSAPTLQAAPCSPPFSGENPCACTN